MNKTELDISTDMGEPQSNMKFFANAHTLVLKHSFVFFIFLWWDNAKMKIEVLQNKDLPSKPVVGKLVQQKSHWQKTKNTSEQWRSQPKNLGGAKMLGE